MSCVHEGKMSIFLNVVVFVSALCVPSASGADFFGLGTGPDVIGRLLSGDGSTLILSVRNEREILRWRPGQEIDSFGFPKEFDREFNSVETNSHGKLKISDISFDGQVFAGLFARGETPDEAQASIYLWSDQTGFEMISPILPSATSPDQQNVQLSNDGKTAYITRRGTLWRWTEKTGTQILDLFPTGVDFVADANHSLALFETSTSTPSEDIVRSFRWSMEVGPLELFESPGFQSTRAEDMTPDGSVVVGSIDLERGGPGRRIFRWTESSGLNVIEQPAGVDDAIAEFVSDDGVVIGGVIVEDSDPQQLFIWSDEAGMVLIDDFVGELNGLRKMTTDGRQLFFETSNADRMTQYVWDRERGVRTFPDLLLENGLADKMEGWQFESRGFLVSDDGNTIVGRGVDPRGLSDLWVAVLHDEKIGDFNRNNQLDVVDIDLLSEQVHLVTHDTNFDLNSDDLVNHLDRTVWVVDLAGTFFGDANLDGEFNTSDLVAVFEAGQYEDDISLNSTWETGDWNGDAEFDSGDLVMAFRDGGYEQGPRRATVGVPEPKSLATLFAGFVLFAHGWGKSRRRTFYPTAECRLMRAHSVR